MAKLRLWSTTAASNNSPVPDGAPEGMPPSGVNDVMRKMMSRLAEWYRAPGWVEYDVPTYISATEFTIPSDRTSDYTQGRRVKATIGSGDIYGTVTGSSFDTVTTVTVKWDGVGALNNTLSLIELSILSTKHQVEASATLQYNEQTSNYTLQASDNGKKVIINSPTAKNVTLPQNSTAALPQGFHCIVSKGGVGDVLFVTQGSDTLISPGGATIAEQGGQAFIDLQVSGTPNKWCAEGRLTD